MLPTDLWDLQGLTRLNPGNGKHDRVNKRNKIFNLIRAGSDHDNGEFPPGHHLLKRNTLVNGQEHVITSALRTEQQIPIPFALEPCPLCCVGFVATKTVAKIEWKALVQQYLQAILASSDSFASSRA